MREHHKDIPRRISEILKEEKLTPGQAAQLIEKTTGEHISLNNVKYMTMKSGFGADKLALFSDTFKNYHPYWILTGKGAKYCNVSQAHPSNYQAQNLPDQERETKLLLEIVRLKEEIADLKMKLSSSVLENTEVKVLEGEKKYLQKYIDQLEKQNASLRNTLSTPGRRYDA